MQQAIDGVPPTLFSVERAPLRYSYIPLCRHQELMYSIAVYFGGFILFLPHLQFNCAPQFAEIDRPLIDQSHSSELALRWSVIF